MAKKVKLIDIHSHIIPDVDDGARNFAESLMLLEMMVEQGVTDVVATPHVNSNATRATWERQVSQFKLLKEKATHLDINIHLGAEVKYRKYLITEYKKYTFENTNYILMEFSWETEEDIFGVLEMLQKEGLKPIMAHVERYTYLTLEDYKEMKKRGILLQVNGNAVLGNGRELWVHNANILVQERLVDFIATDTHNTEHRAPDMKKAYEHLSHKLDENYLNDIFYNNQLKLFNPEK